LPPGLLSPLFCYLYFKMQKNTHWFIYFVIGLAIIIPSCHGVASNGSNEGRAHSIIDIQPFFGLPDGVSETIFNKLSKIYPHVELEKTIELPRLAYYPRRNRYRADSLIQYLARHARSGHIVIGLTMSDISMTKDSIVDWGVMGLGFCPGRACIASGFRLSRKDLPQEWFKIAVHELGHTEGLGHCPVKSCYMRDENGGNATAEETGFCSTCRAFLTGKGWVLAGK
jgi:archaemetzincin